jgi:myo-inositol-1(or 4)-monophosphatase
MNTTIDPRAALAVAESAVRAAGDLLLRLRQRELAVLSEIGHDIKLQADRESEALILSILAEKMPLPVLTEETGEHGIADESAPMWVVDPIDGTFNYARGLPLCCSCVGLWAGGAPVAGAVFNFFTGELFTGIPGTGAWLNGAPIRVSSVTDPAKAALATGFPTYRDLSDEPLLQFLSRVRSFKKIRMVGTAAMAGVFSACGRVDAYAEEDIWLWDVAASSAVAAGAGATLSIRPGHAGKWAREVVFAATPELLRALGG